MGRVAFALCALPLLALLTFAACDHSGGSDDNAPAEADDDDNDDNDAGDDDNNDNNVDDDAGDDDDNDNDDSDDDDDNDDNDDDDSYPILEMIDGGNAGRLGVSIGVAADGSVLVAAAKGRTIALYTIDGERATREDIAFLAEQPSLAIDSQGHRHIAYQDLRRQALGYATDASGAWVVETVPMGYDAGWGLKLALDEQDRPHVLFYMDLADGHTVYSQLYYAKRIDGEWTVEALEVEGGDGYGGRPGLAIDAAGAAHICVGGEYATNRSGAWQSILLDYGSGACATALDAAGRPHVGFEALVEEDLRYATDADGWWWWDWSQETVEDERAPENDMALDANDNPRFAYSGYQELFYAAKEDEAWSATPLGLPCGKNVSLALDAPGAAHIAYWGDFPDSQPHYVTNRSGSWLDAVIDPDRDIGQQTALAVDAAGRERIAYYDADHADLKFAARTEQGWAIETVDAEGDVGAGASLAVDAQGRSHVAYADATHDAVKYAVKDGDAWSIETLSAAWPGGANGIALDAAQWPHVCCCDEQGVLHYWRDAAGWRSERVAADGHACAIAIGGGDVVHLAFITDALIHAVRTADGWDFETVAVVQDDHLMGAVSLRADADGGAAITYTDIWLRFGIEYAYYLRNYAGWWTSQTLGGPISGTSDASLALDAAGNGHIAFRSADGVQYGFDKDTTLTWALIDGFLGHETYSAIGSAISIAADNDGLVHVSYSADGGLWVAVFPIGFAGR